MWHILDLPGKKRAFIYPDEFQSKIFIIFL